MQVLGAGFSLGVERYHRMNQRSVPPFHSFARYSCDSHIVIPQHTLQLHTKQHPQYIPTLLLTAYATNESSFTMDIHHIFFIVPHAVQNETKGPIIIENSAKNG